MAKTCKPLLSLLVAIAPFLSLAALAADSPWLLPNGDFRYWGGSRNPLEGWRFSYMADGASKRIEPQPDGEHPSVVYLKQEAARQASLYQDVTLPKGKYRMTVELTPESARCALIVGKGSVYGKGEDSPLNIVFEGGGEPVRLHIINGEKGEVGVKSARLELLEYEASPVPTNHGQLNSVVIPKDATSAERFAAFEAMRICVRMTGHAPAVTTAAEGPSILIGRAATLKMPQDAKFDAYMYGMDGDGNLHLLGLNDRGTLYALYRFFGTQGCSWITPGEEGETIPERKALALPEKPFCKSPAYSVRGILNYSLLHKIDGGWELYDANKRYDWCLRNGFNACWGGGTVTNDFRDWRGGSFISTQNHSWHLFLNDEHPEWWPLVKGKRQKMHSSGLPNQLCVSNRELRDYAVKYIVDFFREHPEYERFALNADDEPCQWCECDDCRRLDPDEGKGKWMMDEADHKKHLMADRALDFVNEIARRVAEQCPGKTIETSAYGSVRQPPIRQTVDANVRIKYTHFLRDPLEVFSPGDDDILNGWIAKGANSFMIYDYDNYVHPDSVWCALRPSFNLLVDLNRKYRALEYVPESSMTAWGNPMLYALRSDALWGAEKSDFEALIFRHCNEHFGKAGDEMALYYLSLDSAFTAGQGRMSEREVREKDITALPQITLQDLKDARVHLNRARSLAKGDATIERRVDYCVFVHDITAMTVMSNQKRLVKALVEDCRKAYEEATELAKNKGFLFKTGTLNQLRNFYVPPLVEKVVQDLPIVWRFKTDPDDKGDSEKWFSAAHKDWTAIRTDSDWVSQGHEYHGVAWYELEFEYNGIDNADVAILFNAVDGLAWIYLDGALVGTQLESAGKMWNLPYSISIGKLAHGAHRITLKVKKDNFAAGIWKPVSIVTLQ